MFENPELTAGQKKEIEDNDINGSIDWLPRNTKIHYGNVITSDFHKAVLEDGSNCLVFWDDFWQDPTWRASLENTVSNLTIKSEDMAITTTSDSPIASGTITYRTIQTSEWASQWAPRRIRIQAAGPTPPGTSSITYNFEYSTNNGPQPIETLTPGQWLDIPGGVGIVESFRLMITLTNSPVSDRPELYQFSLLVKD